MPKLAFELMTLATTNVAQPLVGTTITPAVAASAVAQSVAVGDSEMFAVSDLVFIDIGTSAEQVAIAAIADDTHISAIFTKAHLAGAFVTLWKKVSAVYCQPTSGGVGDVLLFYAPKQFNTPASFGRDAMTPDPVSKDLCFVILKKQGAAGQPVDISVANNYGANDDNLCFYWIGGTNPDTYLPSCDLT